MKIIFLVKTFEKLPKTRHCAIIFINETQSCITSINCANDFWRCTTILKIEILFLTKSLNNSFVLVFIYCYLYSNG
jgi:hypothetical protein